jgi:diguanylate cyclase (GGDEF)-like protein/PAS domain S-box-containing protein
MRFFAAAHPLQSAIAELKPRSAQMKEILRNSAIFKVTKCNKKLPVAELGQQLLAIFEATTDYIFIVDVNGWVRYLNRSAQKFFGLDDEPAVLRMEKFYTPRARQLYLNEGLPAAMRDGMWNQEMELQGIDGQPLPVSQVMLAHKNANQQIDHFSIIARDISDLKNAERALQIFAKIFESTQEGVMITDAQRRIQKVNSAFSEMTGYTAEEVTGKNPKLLQSGRHDEEFYKNLWSKLRGNGQWQGEIWNRRKNGEIYPEWLTISTIKDDEDNITNYVGIFSDITTIKLAERNYAHMAHHDALTSLPNRVLFHDRLKMALSKAHRNDGMVAVMYLDLDGFKPINDTYGHRIGDLLLQAVAERLINCVREGDTVARMGGDEFTIILDSIASRDDAAKIAQKVLQLITQPFNLEGHQLTLGVSIGISLYPFDGYDGETLIKSADEAMYRIKKQQGNNYQFI